MVIVHSSNDTALCWQEKRTFGSAGKGYSFSLFPLIFADYSFNVNFKTLAGFKLVASALLGNFILTSCRDSNKCNLTTSKLNGANLNNTHD